MRLSINLSEDLVKQIDEKAKELYISRSAFIATALSQKLQNDKVLDTMPNLMKTMQHAIKLEKSKAGVDDGQSDGGEE